MPATVLNTDYFKPIILKFKTFICNWSSKLKQNFCVYGGNASPSRRDINPPGVNFFINGILRKNTSNYAKLMVESDVCDNLLKLFSDFLIIFISNKIFECLGTS